MRTFIVKLFNGVSATLLHVVASDTTHALKIATKYALKRDLEVTRVEIEEG